MYVCHDVAVSDHQCDSCRFACFFLHIVFVSDDAALLITMAFFEFLSMIIGMGWLHLIWRRAVRKWLVSLRGITCNCYCYPANLFADYCFLEKPSIKPVNFDYGLVPSSFWLSFFAACVFFREPIAISAYLRCIFDYLLKCTSEQFKIQIFKNCHKPYDAIHMLCRIDRIWPPLFPENHPRATNSKLSISFMTNS